MGVHLYPLSHPVKVSKSLCEFCVLLRHIKFKDGVFGSSVVSRSEAQVTSGFANSIPVRGSSLVGLNPDSVESDAVSE